VQRNVDKGLGPAERAVHMVEMHHNAEGSTPKIGGREGAERLPAPARVWALQAGAYRVVDRVRLGARRGRE
jgi:hypothetical protein